MTRARLLTIGLLAGAAAAFALAIRSELRGDHAGEPGFDPLSIDPVERDRARARADLAATEESEARAEPSAAADDALAHQLAGPRPGQPGPLLDAVRFGSFGVAIAPVDLGRLHDATAPADVAVSIEGDVLIVVVPDRLADRIYQAWSDPPRDRPLFDAERAVTVSSRSDGDRVRFSWAPYETMAHMLAPGDHLGDTPFSIVGAHVDDVKAALGDHLALGRDAALGIDATWHLPAMEDDHADNVAMVTLTGGVVTAVSVGFYDAPEPAFDALRQAYGDGGASGMGPWRHGRLVITANGHPDGALVTATLAR